LEKVLVSGFPTHFLPYVHQIKPPELELIIMPKGTPLDERHTYMKQATLFLGYAHGDMVPLFEGYRFMQLISAGYDHLDLDALRRFGVPGANNGGANAVGVAEHTIMLMLACLKHLCYHNTRMRTDGRFDGSGQPQELEGLTLGLLGFGKIGQRVAKRLQGWNMKILYHDIYRQSPEVEQAHGVRYVDLTELLASSDFVSVHTPLTKESRHMINATTLAQMKQGSILINTGRGPLVDEQALYAALTSGHIASAGLDVFEIEPVAPENPLLSLANVIATPHCAGSTRQTWEKAAANGFGNLMRFLKSERPEALIPELQDLV